MVEITFEAFAPTIIAIVTFGAILLLYDIFGGAKDR